jgi:hypothetical protein
MGERNVKQIVEGDSLFAPALLVDGDDSLALGRTVGAQPAIKLSGRRDGAARETSSALMASSQLKGTSNAIGWEKAAPK